MAMHAHSLACFTSSCCFTCVCFGAAGKPDVDLRNGASDTPLLLAIRKRGSSAEPLAKVGGWIGGLSRSPRLLGRCLLGKVHELRPCWGARTSRPGYARLTMQFILGMA